MSVSIQRLGPGDEAILELLARDDEDFDLADRGGPLEPLEPAAARRYLANPAVLCWVAVEEAVVIGHLQCIIVPLRANRGQELLLYEIGVRSAKRRQGAGRALLTHMEAWMRTEGIDEVWVLADNAIAVEFYRACGLASEDPQPVYMTRDLAAGRD